MERHIRTLVKTLFWRLFSTIVTIAAVYLYTGKFTGSVALGVSVNLFKMVTYYAYERMWNRISFGRIEVPPLEYHI